MIQRDFLKRQLEELGRAITKIITEILKLKEQGKVNEGIVMTEQALKSTFDLDIENILSIPLDNFIETLIKVEKTGPFHLSYLGDLLYSTAELFEQKNETVKAKKMYQKVLTIFNFIDQTEKTFSLERNKKIEIIEFKLDFNKK